jgi:hypothetical protein
MADMETMETKPKEKLLQALIPEHLWVRLKVTAAINRTSVATLVTDWAAGLPTVEEPVGGAE